MAQQPDSIGIIAGNRSLPLEFARQARAKGVKRLVAVAFENETSPDLVPLVDDIVWLKVGHLDSETAKLEALVVTVERASQRLQEYRTALITAAVTGKIDVRQAKR